MGILILLFDITIRGSELTAIVLGDVSTDVNNPSIMIHGKKGIQVGGRLS